MTDKPKPTPTLVVVDENWPPKVHPGEGNADPGATPTLRDVVDMMTRLALQRALNRNDCKILRAARALGVTRKVFRDKAKRLGVLPLQPADVGDPAGDAA